MGIKKVLVEYKYNVSKKLAAASKDAMIEFKDTGFKIDSSFDPVSVRPTQKKAKSLRTANEISILVRGEIDEDKVEELKSKPNVIGVWTDAKIEHTQDCDTNVSKGDLQAVVKYLGVDEIWNKTRGKGIVIGICDEGIDKNEIKVVNDGWSPWWFLPPGEILAGGDHGNMCATDALGICPEAQVYDIGVLKAQETEKVISNAIAGFQWAIERHKLDGTPHILSNSWNVFRESDGPDYAKDEDHPFTRKVVEAIEEGIIVCFTAGNCGESCPDWRCETDTGPGRSIWGANGHPDVITVGAVNINEELIGYSSQGPAALCNEKPDFCGISHFKGYYPIDTGTSAACPIVAGVIGLLKSANLGLTQDDVKKILQQTAKNTTGNGFDYQFGYGIIQAKAAFEKVKIVPPEPVPPVIISPWELINLDTLIKKSEEMLFSQEDSPKIDYSTKDKALSIVYDGYTTLPKLYNEVFLDPLKNLISTEDYALIMKALNNSGGPWEDWLASINQRTTGYLKEATHAFEEFVSDLYDGYLSMEERRGIKLPDMQTISPLVKWGNPDDGPYTWPADVGMELGMKMAVVNMPPAYSKNIALWAAIGHETGGHDILHADNGLLNEIGNVVSEEIMKHRDDPALKDAEAMVNGRRIPLARLAALYWRYTIDETASDVCGLLNLGPAAGIGIAALLIPLRKGELITIGSKSDVHPIDALRVLLAADVIRNIPDLDANIANAWGDAIEGVLDKYIKEKTDFRLYSRTQSGIQWDVIIPYDGMRETVKIVAKTIAFKPLKSLEGHFLSEINTWNNFDERLTLRIVDDFLNKRQPSLEPGLDGETVYAAHIISGAMIALAHSPDVSVITELAIKALNELYDTNPVWRGFPFRFRSNANSHKMVPNYRKITPERY